MESAQDFKSLQDNVEKALVSAVKSVNRVSNHDLGFQSLANPEVGTRIEESRTRLLKIANRLLKASAEAGRVSAPKLETFEDIETRWGDIVDVLDSNFAKTDAALDEFHAQVKKKGHAMAKQIEATVTETTTATPATVNSKATASALDPSVRHAAYVPKPQLKFEKKVDNFPTEAWKPILTGKPHARVPLVESLAMSERSGDEDQSFKHPYETEILTLQFPNATYQRADPIMYKPIDSTVAKWVDSVEDFQTMLAELKTATEIAIDLEHHDYRTYYGLTCLMQISTRDQDWIVDTLVPWRHRLEALNECFANPNIIKVLHGAFMDVKWLQRDLGLYLVGYFDTCLAADVLNYPAKGLATLLKKFVQFDADKKYQLADWRIRPLPNEMLSYARADTHYLLYIYDMLRNELIEASDRTRPETDLIGLLLQRSQKQALDRYEYPAFDKTTGEGSGGWLPYLLKHPVWLNGEQFAVFRAVWNWRDTEARKADESVHYLLPQPAVRNIAQILPPDIKALVSLIPKHMQKIESFVNGLWRVIQDAIVAGRAGPTMHQFMSKRNEPPKAASKPEPEDKTTNGTPIDFDGVVPAPVLQQSQLFGGISVGENHPIRPKSPKYIPFSWQLATSFLSDAKPSEGETVSRMEPQVPAPFPSEATDETAFNLRGGEKWREKTENQASENGKSGEDIEIESVTKNWVPDDEAHEEPSSPDDAEDTMDLDDAAGSEKEAPKRSRPMDRKGRNKALAKARRSAAKSAKKLAQQQAEAAETQLSEPDDSHRTHAAPFDYAQAPSVLHAQRDQGSSVNGARQAAFNPYSKSGDDGPKGARKAPPLPGGRSATFKK